MSVDLLVAGGGPAGLATALHAARGGLAVVVREPRAAPVDKACGEGLMPGAVARLAALGIEPAGQPLRGIRYLAGRHAAEARFRRGTGRGVRRTELHRALLAAALDAGVRVERRGVADVEVGASRVRAGDLTARYLVAADGLHSPLRRRLGLDVVTRAPRRFGQRQHVAVAPWADVVEVHWGPDAEAYVTPVGPQEVGVAVLSNRRAGYAEQLAAFPELRARLSGARVTSTVRGAGPLRQGSRRRVAGRVLLVGDASGYVDALTGEGITLALAQAEAAVRAILADRPVEYERSWRRTVRSYRLLTEALVRAGAVPAVRRRIVPAARALPPVFDRCVQAIAGTT